MPVMFFLFKICGRLDNIPLILKESKIRALSILQVKSDSNSAQISKISKSAVDSIGYSEICLVSSGAIELISDFSICTILQAGI